MKNIMSVVGAGAGYELNLERQMDRIEDDLADAKIDQQEFDIRKNQIERDSLLK